MKWNILILASVVIAAAGAVRHKTRMPMSQGNEADPERAGGGRQGGCSALLTRYPNNPGVLYLQALTTNEGADAVRSIRALWIISPRVNGPMTLSTRCTNSIIASVVQDSGNEDGATEKKLSTSQYLTDAAAETQQIPRRSGLRADDGETGGGCRKIHPSGRCLYRCGERRKAEDVFRRARLPGSRS